MAYRGRLSFVGGVACCWCAVLWCVALAAPGPVAAATVADLEARYAEALRQVEAARGQGRPLGDPDALFPEGEAVEAAGGALPVDHAGLRAEWRAVPAAGDARRQALDRLHSRLQAVRAELGAGGRPAAGPASGAAAGPQALPPGWRESLTAILQRPEFSKRPPRDSPLLQLLRWLLDRFSSLFPEGTSRAVEGVVRWVVYALAALAFLALLVILIRVAGPLLRRERREPGERTIQPPVAETPEGLLALAESRRRAGDLRGAIQALFRWLLLTLHRSGRLDYDPALTNREHLARLGADARTRAAFAELAAEFELAWYAQRPVSPEAFGAFQSRCSALGGGRP